MVLVECGEIVRAENGLELEKVSGALQSTIDAGGDEDAIWGLKVLIVQVVDIVNSAPQGRLVSSDVRVLYCATAEACDFIAEIVHVDNHHEAVGSALHGSVETVITREIVHCGREADRTIVCYRACIGVAVATSRSAFCGD